MAETEIQNCERSISDARADLVQALANARQELKPASLANRAKQSAMAAISPVIDPVVEKTKSSSGLLVLASSAIAMVFALGRSSTAGQSAPVSQPSATKSDRAPVSAAEIVPAKSPVSKSGINSLVTSAVLAGGGVAAGAFLASRFPLTEVEKKHGAGIGRELADLTKNFVRDNSRNALNATVNSYGIARSAGTLLAILAAVSAAGKADFTKK